MAKPSKIRRQQLLREAEGYLDLVTVFGDQWPPQPDVRDRIAQRALDALGQLRKSDSDRRDVYYLKGQAFRVIENHEEALRWLKKAAKLDPEDIHVHLALGWCFKRLGRLDMAIQSLEDAMDVEPDQGIVHYNLACYWSLANNVHLALEYLSQSFDLDPNYRDLVADESDFDPIRAHPEFLALTGVIV